ncbi:hypothetical protein Ccrd_001564 [Cynara cardunculus var. scolymus]|uniref:Uncharacterized protein n=1 Tax=Cynara cardunculus var. scolymus TaxID=59895 RepID=A0A103XT39_CYNCS|nr:hypothetical protein Ccrd_001564 [Cynara cardunculus var. scolymus]
MITFAIRILISSLSLTRQSQSTLRLIESFVYKYGIGFSSLHRFLEQQVYEEIRSGLMQLQLSTSPPRLLLVGCCFWCDVRLLTLGWKRSKQRSRAAAWRDNEEQPHQLAVLIIHFANEMF